MTATIQTFDFSENLLRALLWQYNKADRLQSLMESKQAWFNENQTDFWNAWKRDIFDLRTANEFGLKIWSILLNIPLFVNYEPSPTSKPTWGFGPYRYNFRGGANFSSKSGGTASLPLETKRLALRLRYFQLTSAGTVPEINRMLAYLFGSFGGAYLNDKNDMTQEYFFKFALPWHYKYIFDNFDILPRPSGVESSYRDSSQKYFGFGQYRLNFERGNMRP